MDLEADHTEELTPEEAIAERAGLLFPVVGIGASAGGFKALADFFSNVPAESGIAYVVIIHLSPDHESNLAAVIQQDTNMPVIQVNESVEIEPNTVYVIPPNKNLSMADGKIEVTELESPRGRRVPIDIFFRTLAETRGPFAAAVVLSGSGTDGTVGLARIKEYAGVVAAQDPKDAEYPEMPRSAVNTGLVDYVLPAGRIPAQVISYWKAAGRIQLPPPEAPRQDASPSAEEAVRDVLTLLRTRTRHDFREYKRSTVLRRIARRMQVNGTDTVAEYLQFMRDHPDEVQALEGDLLISVTNFFRDHDAFITLAKEVIPRLFEGKYASDTVRVWVAGCATGEEAYSIAILLREHADTLPHAPNIQVFATDIDTDAVNVARDGVYPDSIVADVTPERLVRFFTKDTGGYRINKDIRESVLFAVHDVLRDPPFSRLDLISCRNLLIYLTKTAQTQVLDVFHFALRSDGFLFLGTSESVDGVPRLFMPISKREHIFERLNVAHIGQLAAATPKPPLDVRGAFERPPLVAQKAPNPGELHRSFVERFGPPSVLVDQDNNILHISYNANRFLQFVPGEPSNNLLKVVIPSLRTELRSALYRAESKPDVEVRHASVPIEGEVHQVNLSVRVVQEPKGSQGYRLVIFDDIGSVPAPGPGGSVEENVLVHQLEEELQQNKEQLQMLVEQYETSSEELRASNEELQAMNEELRSTTEELETSKEELQAVNEELQTVNHELKYKVEEVTTANNDLQNLLASTDIATIFVNRELKIKRYTPRVRDLFNIIPSDVDRPLAHVTHNLDYDNLPDDASQVLRKLTSIEREVHNSADHWFVVRLSPYRTLDDKIDGVVITFVDITERLKIGEEREALIKQLEAERARFEAVAEQLPAGLTVAEAPSGKLIYVSKQSGDIWGNALKGVESIDQLERAFTGKHPDGKDYTPDEWPLSRALANGEHVSNEQIKLTLKNGERRDVSVSALPVRGRDNIIVAAVAIWSDVSDQKKVDEDLRRANRELELRNDERARELIETTAQLRTEEANHAVRLELMRQLVTAQEDERRRISRELHDELGQLLTGLKFLLDGAGRQAGGHNEQIDEAKSVVDTVVSRIRELSATLRPSVLDDVGLLPALLSLTERFTAQTGVKIDFRQAGLDGRFEPDIETAIYRVVQEALTNVARHSQAREANVSVLADDMIVVLIEDKGVGFNPDAVFSKGSGRGLDGMRERMRLLGGELVVESEPGNGTRVTGEIPFKSQAREGSKKRRRARKEG